MYKYGHYGINLSLVAIFSVILAYTEPVYTILMALSIMSTARLPDIDIRLNFVRHRSHTHALPFAILGGGGYGALISYITYMIIGLFAQFTYYESSNLIYGIADLTPTTVLVTGFTFGVIGCLGHLLGDIITPTGIKPFLPFSEKTYRYVICRADSSIGNTSFMIGGLVLMGIVMRFIIL